MDGIMRFFRPFVTVFLAFLTGIFLLKIVDTILLFSSNSLHFFQTLGPQILYNLIVCFIFGLALLPLYALLRWWKEKAAIGASIALMATLLLSEVGFTAFTYATGALMQDEIFMRPLGEMCSSVSGVMPLSLAVSLALLLMAMFAFLAIFYCRRIKSSLLTMILLALMVVSPLGVPATRVIEQGDRKPAVANYVVNKSWFCFKSTIKNLCATRYVLDDFVQKNGMIEWNEELIDTYLQEFPHRNIIDKKYPLERANDGEDVLSPYFDSISTTPNVVFIIVESLGREWSGENPSGVSFTPFIDSLAHSGLYWKNCLSTTPRSFGAVPAITGSLPFGPKGFQFGRMPQHQSAFSILHNADFQTNVYTASDLGFDCVSDYLMAENTDFLAPFYTESQKIPRGDQRNSWGYHDAQFFERSMQDLNRKSSTKPLCNLFITITSHENLDLGNEKKEHAYQQRIEKIYQGMRPEVKKEYLPNAKRQAAILYTDDCLRNFFTEYRKRDDFKNTIFIITGDHATGLNKQNALSSYHVPLIIWSPLLKRTGQFPNIVSHNDIAPSLCQLLANTYGISMPQTVQWIGDGLDTSSVFNPKVKMTLLDYGRILNLLVYNQYFLSEYGGVFKMDENLNFTEIFDNTLKQKLIHFAKATRYIHQYVYLQNRLCSVQVKSRTKTTKLVELREKKAVVCVTPSQCPSKVGAKRYYYLREKLLPTTEKTDYLDVHFSADVKLSDSLWIDENMMLVILCEGQGTMGVVSFKEVLPKFFTDGNRLAGTWHHIDLCKRFDVSAAKKLHCTIYVTSPELDDYWKPGMETTLKNTHIDISGVHNGN